MHPPRFILGLVITLSFFATLVHAADWQTDYDQALATAKQTNKYVLLDFTGSDWCGPCIQMRKAIFSKPAFMEYARKNLILVEVDFPVHKQLPENRVKQNDHLKHQYEVDRSGYPTVVLLGPNGKILGRLEGYGGERPAEMIAWIEHQREKQ
jgi:thioredoxin-related protein